MISRRFFSVLRESMLLPVTLMTAVAPSSPSPDHRAWSDEGARRRDLRPHDSPGGPAVPLRIRQGRLLLHQARVADLPLPDGSLDGVMTVNTIHHFDDLAAASPLWPACSLPGAVWPRLPGPDASTHQPATTRHEHWVRDVDEVRGRAGLRRPDRRHDAGTTPGGVYTC